LSRTPADQIRAGTVPYVDPFLSLRKPPRWDRCRADSRRSDVTRWHSYPMG
jgi:hypothetical protein